MDLGKGWQDDTDDRTATKNKNKKRGGGGGKRRGCKKYSFKFSTFVMTLTTAIQSFWKTFWLIVMHHSSKFGCKRISDLESRKPYFDDVNPYLEVEENKLMFLHDALVHINTPLFQVWL